MQRPAAPLPATVRGPAVRGLVGALMAAGILAFGGCGEGEGGGSNLGAAAHREAAAYCAYEDACLGNLDGLPHDECVAHWVAVYGARTIADPDACAACLTARAGALEGALATCQLDPSAFAAACAGEVCGTSTTP